MNPRRLRDPQPPLVIANVRRTASHVRGAV